MCVLLPLMSLAEKKVDYSIQCFVPPTEKCFQLFAPLPALLQEVLACVDCATVAIVISLMHQIVVQLLRKPLSRWQQPSSTFLLLLQNARWSASGGRSDHRD